METITLETFERSLFAFALCVPRLLTVFLVVPFTSATVLSFTVRAGLTISLAVIVFPLVISNYPETGLKPVDVMALVVKEIFVGFVIGYSVAIFFWGVEAVGNFIDTHRGATLSDSLLMTFGDSESPFASLLSHTFIVLFFIGGGVYLFLDGLYLSYKAWPILSFYPGVDLAAVDYFIAHFALIAYTAIIVGGPIVIAMFMAEVSLALLSRFVPQLQVFFLSLPIKSAVAVFVLILYAATLVTFLKSEMAQFSALFTDLDGLFK